MNRLKIFAIALVALLLTPLSANAFDIPLLTWERGREQQVVLGGGAYARDWNVILEGNGIEPLQFTPSSKNEAGYVVYSLQIPNDLPIGAYSIVTNGDGSTRTVVAGVNLIPAITKTATGNLFDLTLIIAIFAFLTALVSTIRARKYLFINFMSTQRLPRLTDPVLDSEVNFWDRLEGAPYRLRIQGLLSLQPSLFRFLLIREGELSHRISKNLYGLAPIIGFAIGAIAAIEVERNGGLVATSITIFILVSAFAIFDAIAGLTATLGYWAVQLATGNVTSFRDVLVAVGIGLAWIGPSLFAALLRETIDRDFKAPQIAGQDPIKFLGIVGSSLVGGAVFYLGHALVNSILYSESQVRAVGFSQVLIIFGALMIRGFADGVVLHSDSGLELRDESFAISRVSSPVTAISVLLTTFAFLYIWTESAGRAAIVAALFSLPYFLIFIRFNRTSILKNERIPRNILIESSLVTAATFIAFREISQQPLLLDQRANLLLLLAGIAPVIHAIYSAIYSSNEDKFSFEENPEIIRP